jgi:hypothetical protein
MPDFREARPMAAISADRDLLFGLLALQVGLIDQGQLVAAFQAWTRDRARHLADHLAARGDLDTDQRAGVEAMVGLHLKKHGGSAEMSLAAIPPGGPPASRSPRWATPRSSTASPSSHPAPMATPTAPRATPWERRPSTASGSACCGRTPAAAWAPSSWRWTRSCIARWR